MSNYYGIIGTKVLGDRKQEGVKQVMVFFSAFVFVLSILLFEVYLHQGKLKGNSAIWAAILVAGICSVALVFFMLGVIHGGQIVSG